MICVSTSPSPHFRDKYRDVVVWNNMGVTLYQVRNWKLTCRKWYHNSPQCELNLLNWQQFSAVISLSGNIPVRSNYYLLLYDKV